MADEQHITRANRASELLENDAFKQAISAMKEHAIDAFKQCPARDKDGFALIQMHLNVVEKLEGMLRGFVESGRLAKIEIERKSVAERVHNLWRKSK
jgi:hypothetical protein